MMSRFRLTGPSVMRVDKAIENLEAEGMSGAAESDATGSVVGR